MVPKCFSKAMVTQPPGIFHQLSEIKWVMQKVLCSVPLWKHYADLDTVHTKLLQSLLLRHIILVYIQLPWHPGAKDFYLF